MISLANTFVGDIRTQSGGYNPATYHIQTYFGCLGIVFAFVGFLGVTTEHRRYLLIFEVYQWAKLVLMVVVFAADMMMLRKCEKWVGTVESVKYPNAALESISAQGLCPITRMCYAGGFLIDFSFQWYCNYITRNYAACLYENAAYNIYFSLLEHHHHTDARHLSSDEHRVGPAFSYGGEIRTPSGKVKKGAKSSDDDSSVTAFLSYISGLVFNFSKAPPRSSGSSYQTV